MTDVLPYGSWPSPINAELITEDMVTLDETCLDGSDYYWLESRPGEQGRVTLVRLTADSQPVDLIPPPFNCRSRVNEYGGGAYSVHNGSIYFSNFSDNQLYALKTNGTANQAEQISFAKDCRYAALTFDAHRQRLICVREDHSQSGEPVTTLVAIAVDGNGREQVLARGKDFYASPQISPNGEQLCWLSWSHPCLPWDGTELWVSDFAEDGSLKTHCQIAGGSAESVFQPQWSPQGGLFFVSDRSGWWNIYQWHCGQWRNGEVNPLVSRAAEFGVPQWVFGQSTYAFLSDEAIICCFCERGRWRLATITLADGELTEIETSFCHFSSLHALNNRAVFIGTSDNKPSAVIAYQPLDVPLTELATSGNVSIEDSYISAPRHISFASARGHRAYAIFYPPRNDDYRATQDEKPPLLVVAHGGPTSAAEPGFNPGTQFWTSRGFAVLLVNYSGSANYGREYRQRLREQWGIVDVEDCIAGAEYLAEQKLVDPLRMAIRGTSAGGFTVLCALTFHSAFSAGASYYGISDLEQLAADTHKFESRYLEGLVGPYPQSRERYRQRSPLYNAEQLNCPSIFFQGLEDKVVPPNQAEKMVTALRQREIPVAHITFDDEAHGFRKAQNIRFALSTELHFYGRVFNFEPAEQASPDTLSLLPDEQ